jgi:hypothetical protein
VGGSKWATLLEAVIVSGSKINAKVDKRPLNPELSLISTEFAARTQL